MRLVGCLYMCMIVYDAVALNSLWFPAGFGTNITLNKDHVYLCPSAKACPCLCMEERTAQWTEGIRDVCEVTWLKVDNPLRGLTELREIRQSASCSTSYFSSCSLQVSKSHLEKIWHTYNTYWIFMYSFMVFIIYIKREFSLGSSYWFMISDLSVLWCLFDSG